MDAEIVPLPSRRKDAEILSQIGRLLDQIQSDEVREKVQEGWELAVSQLIFEKWFSGAPGCAVSDGLSFQGKP